MTQTKMTAVNNKNLFSNYYLDNQIKNNPEWEKKDHIEAFNKIKKIYDAESAFLETLNEKQLEQRFFGPIFKILNLTFEVNESTGNQEFPDYAFFSDRSSLDDAHKNKGMNSFYNNSFAIGEVKRWGIELDRFGKDKNDRKRNPSLQIWIYLHDVTPKWGILTNGESWRLYCKERGRYEYYEVDLPSLLATGNVEEFRYFYYFFRREAFPFQDAHPFLERLLQGSVDYANEIGDDLKENVYKAMKKIAEGFFFWKQNGLDVQNESDRQIVQKNTMLLLYRFLFLLYAEGKGLLDIENGRYRTYSFYQLKNNVKENRDGPLEQRYQNVGTSLWSKLKDLFRLIDQGSESFGIPKNELDVPAYNGGLFDPEKHPELEKWLVGDSLLAEAIDLLSRSNVGGKLDFVDYSTLEIRHLGSIYEGLLEYKLKISEEDMIVKSGEWVDIDEYNKGRKQTKVFSDFDEFKRVKCGELYLATDKGERKSTGSYYTPDYIVNYIVSNTVGPVVDEKWKEAEVNDQSFVDATLSTKVLDPAMGSGHFLVGAIDFLSGKLLQGVQRDIEAGRITDDAHYTPDWAHREVVSHCIYGVDMNDMAVELAKVSLWLTTISKDKPLSFLDHRLKQGNSLIGAQLIDLPWYPDLKAKIKKRDETVLKKFEEEVHKPFVDKIVNQLKQLSEIDDDTIEHIHQKKELFEKLKENKQYLQIKSIADVYTAVYFGNETTEVNKNPKFAYNDLFWALKGDDREWLRKTYKPWFKKAMEISKDKSFFHWELEFPEIFFKDGAPKENPGWDAVVGNPPYVRQEEIKEYKPYFELNYDVYTSIADLYVYFYEKGHKLLKLKSKLGFISSNKFLKSNYGKNLRKLLLNNYYISKIVDFGELPVFEDATTYPAIVLTENISSTNSNTIYAPILSLNFTDLEKIVLENGKEIPYTAMQGPTWSLQDEKNYNILKKLETHGESLQIYTNGVIRFGIKTGFNKAYIINKEI